MKKLSKRQALTALLFGIAGTLAAGVKQYTTNGVSVNSNLTLQNDPIWLTCDEQGTAGVRLTSTKGKSIEITFNQIFEALE